MNDCLILKNATVYDGSLSAKRVAYIGIKDGKIAHIGEDLPDFEGIELDFKGNVISKPFCDYHYHLPGCMLYDLFGVNLSKYSFEEYKSVLQGVSCDMSVIRGFGWELSSMANYFECSSVTPLEFIDELFPDRPVVLFSLDFHSCWCNSVALSILEREGIRASFEDSEVKNGKSCILHEDIAQKIFNSDTLRFSDAELEGAILKEQEHLISLGVLEVYSLMFIGADCFSVLGAIKRLCERSELKIKIHYAHTITPDMSLSLAKTELDTVLTYTCDALSLSAIKIYADGVIDNHSAFLIENYADKLTRGCPIWSPDGLDSVIELALSYGLPIHAHAIGDGAVEMVALALSRHEAPKNRHIITHIQLCSREAMRLMAENNIVACMQPFWFYRGKNALEVDRARLGDRVRFSYPVESLLNGGVKVLFSSDCPATSDPNPLSGIRVATSSCDGECVDIKDAFYAYMVGSYENITPEISVGDKASFIVLDNDIIESNSAKIIAVYANGKRISKIV